MKGEITASEIRSRKRYVVSNAERREILSVMETDDNYTAFSTQKLNEPARARIHAHMIEQKSQISLETIDYHLRGKIQQCKSIITWLNRSGQGVMSDTQSLANEIERRMPDFYRYRNLYFYNKGRDIQDVPANFYSHVARDKTRAVQLADKRDEEEEQEEEEDHDAFCVPIEEEQDLEIDEGDPQDQRGTPNPASSTPKPTPELTISTDSPTAMGLSRTRSRLSKSLFNGKPINSRVGKSNKTTLARGKNKGKNMPSVNDLTAILADISSQNAEILNIALKNKRNRDETRELLLSCMLKNYNCLLELRQEAISSQNFSRVEYLSKELSRLEERMLNVQGKQ